MDELTQLKHQIAMKKAASESRAQADREKVERETLAKTKERIAQAQAGVDAVETLAAHLTDLAPSIRVANTCVESCITWYRYTFDLPTGTKFTIDYDSRTSELIYGANRVSTPVSEKQLREIAIGVGREILCWSAHHAGVVPG